MERATCSPPNPQYITLSSSSFALARLHCKAKSNSVDDSVAACNIDRVIRIRSESLLSNNGIIDKVLPHSITVGKLLSSEGGEVGAGDISRGDESGNDVHLDDASIDGSTHGLVRGDGGVLWCEVDIEEQNGEGVLNNEKDGLVSVSLP